MHFEVLKKSSKQDNSRDYYMGIQINSTIDQGEWVLRVLSNNVVLCEEAVEYKVLRTSYQHPKINGSTLLDIKS